MRVESSVTSISWIPSEAITALPRVMFDLGVTHYDDPPPDAVDDLDALLAADRFRFANELRAWIDVEGGRVVGAGHAGRGLVSASRVAVGPARVVFAPTTFPELRNEPELGGAEARFVQTVGGRTGLVAPRRVDRRPWIQLQAPTVWTTLALTIRADGTSDFEVVGASPFPRHWVYDGSGALVAKVGTTRFEEWWHHSFGTHTPWGDEESPALLTAAETALERRLSVVLMHGSRRPRFRKLDPGDCLVHQGEPGDELFLLLDGVAAVEVDGEPLAEVGPGAVLGERALLDGGRRTATVRATTPCRVAVATAADIEPPLLAELRDGHRREEQRGR